MIFFCVYEAGNSVLIEDVDASPILVPSFGRGLPVVGCHAFGFSGCSPGLSPEVIFSGYFLPVCVNLCDAC